MKIRKIYGIYTVLSSLAATEPILFAIPEVCILESYSKKDWFTVAARLLSTVYLDNNFVTLRIFRANKFILVKPINGYPISLTT